MSRNKTFYWHDYETWGIDPRRDRAVQFAGIRTDLNFKPIGQPLEIYARPADDFLPNPQACMVTGITPQKALEGGVPEADFFAQINKELAQPGTCGLGYNSIRFDDEFTRYGLYRNFFDPYAREWQNGNSRWDIIDMVRLTHALRPEGIEWPENEEGVTSFKLELLTAANGIEHKGAHDALVDVKATIALAQLVNEKQPKLFDFVFNNRNKKKLAQQLNLRDLRPVLHVSAKYPARLGCIAAVVPVAQHPVNKNGIIVFDLRADPSPLSDLSVEQIRERLFTPAAELPKGVERIPLKTISINHAPVVVPMGTLTGQVREKWQMEAEQERKHLQIIRATPGLQKKLSEVFAESPFPASTDPDQSLYSGFLSDHDRRLCEEIRKVTPEELVQFSPAFGETKLHEMLFRYRARNWPDTLTRDEAARWDEYRRERLTNPDAGASIVLDQYARELSHLAIDVTLQPEKRVLIDQLLDWPQTLGL